MKEQSSTQEVPAQKDGASKGMSSAEGSPSTTGGVPKGPPPEKRSIAFYIHCLIGFFFMFIFGHVVEPIGTITPLGMQILGVFIGAVYMWTIVNILWPSLLGLVALGLTDIGTVGGVIVTSFGNTTILAILFAFILFGAVEHSGVATYISRWFLTRKIINGRPIVFSFILMYCAFILSAATNPLPAILLMWAVLYATVKDLGLNKTDTYAKVMVIGIFYGAISGQATIPFTGSALALIGIFYATTDLYMSYMAYMLLSVVVATVGITAYCLLMKFVFRPDMSKLAGVNVEMFDKEPLPPMNTQQKLLFGSIFAFIGLVMLPTFFTPGTVAAMDALRGFTPAGVAIFLIAILCFINVDGKPVLNFKEITGKYVNWGIVLLVVLAIALANNLMHPDTGIRDMITLAFEPVLGGQGAAGFSILTMVTATLITQVTNNVIVGALLLPVIYIFGVPIGIDIAALFALVIFMIHLAMLLPAATAYTPLLWGNREWVSVKDIMKYGIPVTIVSLILYVVIGVPVANFIFSIFN